MSLIVLLDEGVATYNETFVAAAVAGAILTESFIALDTLALSADGDLEVSYQIALNEFVSLSSASDVVSSVTADFVVSAAIASDGGISLLTTLIATESISVGAVADIVASIPSLTAAQLTGALTFTEAQLSSAGFNEAAIRIAHFRSAFIEATENATKGARFNDASIGVAKFRDALIKAVKVTKGDFKG